MEDDKHYRKMAYVEAHRKTQMTSFILTFLFGPLGLLYATAWPAAIMLSTAAFSAFKASAIFPGMAPIIIGGAFYPFSVVVLLAIWIISIPLGDSATRAFNDQLITGANLHRP